MDEEKKGFSFKRAGLLFLIGLVVMIGYFGFKSCTWASTDRDPSNYYYYKCSHCHGTGKQLNGKDCYWCDGTGISAVHK